MTNLHDRVNHHYEQNLASLRAAAETEKNKALPLLTEDKFALYAKTGNRLIYEKDYYDRRRALLLYGIVSIIDKTPAYLQRLEDIIRCICEEETWALPAHVKRDTDPNWRRTVDLFASETAQSLAEIITVLKDHLTEETQNIARENIIFRVLDPFFNAKAPYSWWEKGANNWNAVCCGCIGSAALYLNSRAAGSGHDKNSSCINRVLESLEYYVNSFPEDGACLEGLAYFSYGMGYYTTFARQLKEATNGAINLLKTEKLARIAAYQSHAYFAGGGSVPFSDGDPHEKFRLGLSCYLSALYEEAFLPPIESAAFWDTDFNYRWATAYRDVIWTQEWLQNSKNNTINATPPNHYQQYDYLSSQQVLIHDPAHGISIGVKGGHNGEPHNHNDVGSFFLMKDGEVFLEDLGFGEYTKDYFVPAKRYEYFVTRTLGHNIPLLNGLEQSAGKTYRCTYFWAEDGHVVMEIGAAYGEHLHLRREFSYNKETGELTITDSSPQTITENLVTRIKPEITDEGIIIIGKKAKCLLTMPPTLLLPQIMAESYQDHYGITQTAYRIILSYGTYLIITIK